MLKATEINRTVHKHLTTLPGGGGGGGGGYFVLGFGICSGIFGSQLAGRANQLAIYKRDRAEDRVLDPGRDQDFKSGVLTAEPRRLFVFKKCSTPGWFQDIFLALAINQFSGS